MSLERLDFEETVYDNDSGGLPEDEEKRLRKLQSRKRYGPYEYLIKFARAIKRDVRNDYDAVIMITGEREGIGKSVLAMQLSMLMDTRFRLDRNVVYDPNVDSVREKLGKLPRYTPIVFDEAVKVLYNREWYSKVNNFLNKYYKVSRKFNQISLMCIPDRSDMDAKFMQTKVMWWLHVIDRGIAIVRVRDWLADSEDKWHIGYNKKRAEALRRQYKVHQVTTEMKLKFYRKSPNYVGYLRFPDLPVRMKKNYRALSEEASRKFDLDGEGGDSRLDEAYESAGGLVEAGVRAGLNLKELSEFAGVSSSTLSRWLKKRGKSTRDIKEEVKKEKRLRENPLVADP